MIFFLFLLVIGLSFLQFTFYSNKIAFLKRKTLLLNQENLNLKNKINTLKKQNNHIEIAYIKPDFNKAIICKLSKIYSAPSEKSPLIEVIEFDTSVTILDSALVDECIWYHIALPKSNNINSKGWIKEVHLFLIKRVN